MRARDAILLVGDSLQVGGTEGQFVETACGLDRARWDVHLTCLRAAGPLRARLEAAGLSAWSCGPGSFKSPRIVLAVRRIAQHVRAHRIGLVHCFDFYSNVLGVLAARVARVPVIASQRELGDLRSPLQRRVYRALMRLADYTLVNARAVAERLGDGRDGRLVVIDNGVDTERFAPAPVAPRTLAGHVTLGTLANLRPEKGLEHLITAMTLVAAHDAGARLVVWGGGPLHDVLASAIDTLGLGARIELRGPTTLPALALRAVDVFVLPSLSEACSNVLLEAMASGLPVIATRVGGNPALVEDGASGLLVPPADPRALAAAMLRLAHDPALAARLGAAARAAVSARFSLPRMVARLDALYTQALGLPARRVAARAA